MASRYEELRITAPLIAWTVVITAILTVIGNVFVYFLPSIATCNLNVGDLIPTPGVDLLGIPFVMTVVIAALMRIPSVKKHMTAGNLVFLYVVALASSAFANQDSPWREASELLTAGVGTSESILQHLPAFVAPPKEAAEALVQGRGSITAIPWDLLTPALVWRFLSFAFFAGISIGLVSIFRRQWIDVEMLPYPQVTIAYSAIAGVREVGRPEWVGRMPFILGFIVGFLLELTRTFIVFFPWFPDVYMWRSNTCGPGCHQITLIGTTWHYGIAKHTPLYALIMLAPLHSLFSIVFWGLVYEVASAVACAVGYYTGYTDMGFCGRSWCSENTPFADPPLAFGCLITGVMLGAFVMTVFHERAHIVRTLKMAFGVSRDMELEAREPMSYRSAWAIFIVSYVLMVALFTYAGMSLWASFVVTLTGVVTWFTVSQLWARIGFSNEPGYNFGPGFMKMLVWPTEYALPVTSTDLALAPTITYELASHRPSVPWCTTFYTVIGSYKMASLMNVHPRNVAKVAFVALIVAMFTGVLMNAILPGIYGMGVTTCHGNYDLMGRITTVWTSPSPHPMTDIAPWIAGGFVFMVVMSLLHARFLWMPDPLMSIVAWDWVCSLHGVWTVALVCAIIKWLVLRIGGSRLYEERVVPFVGGFILGDTLNAIIAGILAFTIFRPV